MDLGLKGRVALVMASSQGLGKASARSLAGEGCNLVISARREGPLQATKAQIEQESGVKVLAVPADTSTAGGVSALVAATMKEYGRIDVLVTNSGPPAHGDLLEMSDEIWHSAIENQMMGVVRACREVVPVMVKQKWGRVVHITSTSIKQPLGPTSETNSPRLTSSLMSRTATNAFELRRELDMKTR